MATGKVKTKIDSKGRKTRRKFCSSGFSYDSATGSCKKMSASERSSKRRAVRKAVRTKRADKAGQNRAKKKRLKAIKKRKALGLR